jgi:hypothetical protein
MLTEGLPTACWQGCGCMGAISSDSSRNHRICPPFPIIFPPLPFRLMVCYHPVTGVQTRQMWRLSKHSASTAES